MQISGYSSAAMLAYRSSGMKQKAGTVKMQDFSQMVQNTSAQATSKMTLGVVNECDDMGLGEQVILSDEKKQYNDAIKAYEHTGNGVSWSQFEWKTYDTQMTVTFEDSVKVESISKKWKV